MSILEVVGAVKGLTDLPRWTNLPVEQNLYSVWNLWMEKTMLENNRDQMERSLSGLLRKENMIKNQSN